MAGFSHNHAYTHIHKVFEVAAATAAIALAMSECNAARGHINQSLEDSLDIMIIQ